MQDVVVRILTEVRHISKLKKNLVPLGAMDSKSFSCWLRVELCRSEGKESLW